MSDLHAQISQMLPPGMVIPDAIAQLFTWIERNGLFVETEDDQRIGFLFPQDELELGWTETERPGGTQVEFFADDPANLQYWFGNDDPAVLNRLRVFAKTGAEGSMAAFWLDPEGNQKIVHLGSGSGSTLVCVLAEDPIDFLRLLAIGYDELCWSEQFSSPPNANLTEDELFVYPNVAFQQWVTETFGVTLPETAIEIVKCPAHLEDSESADPFHQWVRRHVGSEGI